MVNMTFRKAWVAAGLALAICSAPASAADFGGIKEIGGDVPVPVPAPAPVPTYDYDSDWYVGLAIGANISQSATITDTDRDYLGDRPPGSFRTR
jgi:opacity protein-like surface antigen